MRAYITRNVHFNDFFVNKKFLLNECSCTVKLNYNMDKKKLVLYLNCNFLNVFYYFPKSIFYKFL